MSAIRLRAASGLAEQFEVLKYRVRSLLNGSVAPGGGIVAFTSCKGAEGVSSIAANFAAVATEDGEKRVLLMDCNLHRPSLYNLLECKKNSRKNLPAAEKAEGFESVWKVVHADHNLDVLITRKMSASSATVFNKGWFADLLGEAHGQYDSVILDCPPLLEDASASYLAAKAHGVVLVVEAERVKREIIQRSIDLLEDSGARILGVVLNKRRYPIPQWIYKML